MKRFTTGLALAGTLAFLVAVALTVIDIVLRTVSEYTVHGLTDIVTLCTMIGALLAIPYGFVQGEHVAIDVFVSRLSPGWQRAFALFAALLGTVLLSAIAWFGFNQMITEYGYGDRSQSIGIPMTFYWVPLVLGMAIAALTNFWLLYRYLISKNGESQ